MSAIELARAKNVTIRATVGGGGGDWAALNEVYPIVLGWGVELNAPGVFFLDPHVPGGLGGQPHIAIFDVDFYSANDTLGYASVVGTATSQIGIGMNGANTRQLWDTSALSVEANNTLYLANASVNGSFANYPYSFVALLVRAGATLIVGQDESSRVTGTVNIGNALGQPATNGSNGIYCGNYGTTSLVGCAIKDAPLVDQSALVVQGQALLDIDAEDFSNISLTARPVVGVPPSAAGFGRCPTKIDGSSGNAAVLLNGLATMDFENGTVQCLGGTGFRLVTSPLGNGNPSLTLRSTTIQNTDLGIYASAGTATMADSTLIHNFNGVQQDSDGVNVGTIDLSGGGNTVICSSNQESSLDAGTPGIDVYNTSTENLKADHVAWDTSGPDYFSCNSTLTTCTCNLTACSVGSASDGMDAVESTESFGGISTTHNSLSTIACH